MFNCLMMPYLHSHHCCCFVSWAQQWLFVPVHDGMLKLKQQLNSSLGQRCPQLLIWSGGRGALVVPHCLMLVTLDVKLLGKIYKNYAYNCYFVWFPFDSKWLQTILYPHKCIRTLYLHLQSGTVVTMNHGSDILFWSMMCLHSIKITYVKFLLILTEMSVS